MRWISRVGEGRSLDLRHDTRHRDQTVDTSETDGNTPQPRSTDDPLTHRHVPRRETQDGTCTIRLLKVDITTGMILQSREVDMEAEGMEV